MHRPQPLVTRATVYNALARCGLVHMSAMNSSQFSAIRGNRDGLPGDPVVTRPEQRRHTPRIAHAANMLQSEPFQRGGTTGPRPIYQKSGMLRSMKEYVFGLIAMLLMVIGAIAFALRYVLEDDYPKDVRIGLEYGGIAGFAVGTSMSAFYFIRGIQKAKQVVY